MSSAYSASAPFDRFFDALLFDMDGTLIDSVEASEAIWRLWADRHGVDVDALLANVHGVRGIDTVRRFAPVGVDPPSEIEALILAEMEAAAGIGPIAGVAAFLASLPPDRWAVVTSSTRALARRRLALAGLPAPAVLITAEDVANGKPAPDCFRLAAERLGHPIENCLAFEDAPAGIEAARAAGATVVVVTVTHKHPLEARHAAIRDFLAIGARLTEQGLRIEFLCGKNLS